MNDNGRATFLGLTKSTATLGISLIGLVALGLLVWALAARNGRAQDRLDHNAAVVAQLRELVVKEQRALGYICSTTSVLDRLVVSAHAQIKESLDNGTYQRLHLPKANARRARSTVVAYAAAHEQLRHNGACKEVATGGGDK